MPLTIKTGAMYYKDPTTGNYMPINAIGDTTSAMIAPDYEDFTFPIPQGAHCVHNGVIYCASQTISESENWTAAHWTAVANVMAEISALSGAISQLEESIAPVEETVTATAAHAVGELFMMGETLLVALSAIAVGDTITTTGGSPNAAVTTLSAKLIKDVQVNGTSVLSQGVANVPKASDNMFGTIKVMQYSEGLYFNSQDRLSISRASDTQIKNGTDVPRPLTPNVQNASTFYGLAKAAGDSTQSASSNAVGTYTESAKSAISQMLDAPETVSGTTPSITAKSGVRYVCGECATLTIVAPASGCIDVIFTSGSTATVLAVSSAKTGVTAIKWAGGFDPTSLDANATYEVNVLDGEYGVVGSWS